MSILHICCNLAGSTVFPQMFEALREKSLEQIVFVPEKRRKDMGKNEPEGVETHYACTVRRLDTVFFSRKARRSVPAIEKRVDMGKVRLMHAHTLFTDGSIAYALHKKYAIPYVVTLRYSDIEAIWKYMPHLHGLAREILKNAAKIIFLSESAKDKVLKKWLKKADRVLVEPKTAVIPNGIKAEWLDGAPRETIESPMRVGFAGKMVKRKRPLDVLAAVHLASENGTPCVLRAVGEGKQMNDLKELVKTMRDEMDVVRDQVDSQAQTDDKRTQEDKDEEQKLRDELAADLQPTVPQEPEVKTAAAQPVQPAEQWRPVNIMDVLGRK